MTTKKQQNTNNSHTLSELGQQAKGDLEVLVATGKTKDFLGKQLTFLEMLINKKKMFIIIWEYIVIE